MNQEKNNRSQIRGNRGHLQEEMLNLRDKIKFKESKMQNVKVRKSDLMTVVESNREKHITEFNSAKKIFIEDAIEKLQDMLTTAQKNGRIIQNLGLTEPISYVQEYDTAIKMLQMSTEDVIELTQQEFQQYVEDQWSWKRNFVASTSIYNNKLGM